jgi:hypothetical protein
MLAEEYKWNQLIIANLQNSYHNCSRLLGAYGEWPWQQIGLEKGNITECAFGTQYECMEWISAEDKAHL